MWEVRRGGGLGVEIIFCVGDYYWHLPAGTFPLVDVSDLTLTSIPSLPHVPPRSWL